jgi:hypothetical protein
VTLAWFFGPTTAQLNRGSARTWDWLARLAWHIFPQTTMEWGIDAIAAAFVFLGIGAALSLRHRLPPPLPMPMELEPQTPAADGTA